MTDDTFLVQALADLRESNRRIADATVCMKENLKTLNDHNILHHERNSQEHNTLTEQIQLLTGKYWWLILVLLSIILIVMGYKEAITLL